MSITSIDSIAVIYNFGIADLCIPLLIFCHTNYCEEDFFTNNIGKGLLLDTGRGMPATTALSERLRADFS